MAGGFALHVAMRSNDSRRRRNNPISDVVVLVDIIDVFPRLLAVQKLP